LERNAGTLGTVGTVGTSKRRFYVSSIAVQKHFWNELLNALWNAYCEHA
jgi:hypothetical protein